MDTDILSQIVTLGIVIAVAVPLVLLSPKETCPLCGERRRLKKLSSTRDQSSVETLMPSSFQTRQYQETWKCQTCSETFTKVKMMGKNKNGSFS